MVANFRKRKKLLYWFEYFPVDFFFATEINLLQSKINRHGRLFLFLNLHEAFSSVFQFVSIQRWSALFQSCSALVFSESALFSAGWKQIEKPTKMLRVSSKKYWNHEKHVLLECTSYEKIIPAKFQSKVRIAAPASSSWSHVTCRIVKRLKYRVLSKKWTENKAKVVLISIFFYYFRPKCDEFWPALNSAESEENSPEQLWNSSETALNRADYL